MNIFKFITNILFITLIAVIAFLAFVRSGEYLNFLKKQERNLAIDSCYAMSKFTTDNTNDGTKIEEPIMDKFEQCLMQKEIK